MLAPKFVYIVCNLGSIAVVLYKCLSLGLLPTQPADYASFWAYVAVPTEYSLGGGGVGAQ